ncbi:MULTISPECIES: hypothetical protein [Acidithiobacillus]|uniref:hypothetical protein n=1 Tax=Acidithiobacillus TaxID=119977 RepID=UPI0020CAC22C|nr:MULTISPECIES: hypothetical protein [Acidithiobacillus]MDA8177571.1 hypothetical protein [Acidithiobacillus sp.]
MALTDIPQDLREELAVLADLLPEQSPLPYAKARLLVLSWTRLGEDALAWAGANLVMKIDPDPYESGDPAYGPTPMQTENRSVDLWKPFSPDYWREHGQEMSLFELAIYLKLKLGTWGTTPIARRRHVTKDRLDGLGLGCQIHPARSTASIFLSGKRSLVDIIETDLMDQIK